jgi:diguanylate cyclase (GGDEF)-like protein/PAS domain S-box-containing protein
MDGVVVAWDKGAEELLCWNEKEAIGKSAFDLFVCPEKQAAVKRAMEQVRKTGGTGCLNKWIKSVLLNKQHHAVQAECMVTIVHKNAQPYFSITLRSGSEKVEMESSAGQHVSMLGLSRDAIFVTDIEGEILLWNHGAETMFGYTEQEALGRNRDELLSPQYPVNLSELKRELITTGHWEGKISYITRDGTKLTTLSRWALERENLPGRARILISNTDISLWQAHLDTPTFSKAGGQNFDSLFRLHPDGVLAFNLQGQLVAANPAMSALTGYSTAELLAMPIEQLVTPEDLGKLRFNFSKALRGTSETHEFTCIKKDKTRFDAGVTMLPYVTNGKISGLHVIVKDISHRKLDERRILYLATHDSLTGLANRDLLNDRMRHAIEQARRLQSQVGVLFMDLNRFKVINDSLGHEKGDILLCTIADRLRSAVREVDTVARLGGDEFVILLENITATDHISTVAKNLLKLVKQPIELEGNILTVSASIGTSIYPQDGSDPATLLKNADMAMYEAKRLGPDTFRSYTAEMKVRVSGQLARESSLRQAIDRGELVLHYQPRMDIARNRLVGVEALVRWDHPEKGLILPANFIPLAEEIGIIDTLGEWVLLSACQQLKTWRDSGLSPLKMSVNVSTIQFRSESLLDTVEEALTDTGLDPSCLELEITESSLMQNLDASFEKLMKVRNLGVSLSIDDFGTGYSSLSYLKRLPIDTLKIDKSFVREVPENIDDAAIVSATIAMAHSMNLRVVAEGVTSLEQMRFLESCHCDEMQGFLLCQPLPAAEAELFFKTSQMRGIYSWAH